MVDDTPAPGANANLAAPAVATRVTSTSTLGDGGYPNGHLGHLNDTMDEALRSFKTVLQERGLYTPGNPPSHDDVTLLRFLRARRWDVEQAFQQFKTTEEWRVSHDIDTLYRTIDLKAYESSRRLYPQWTGRRDRRGIPLYVFEIKHLDSKTVSQYEKEGAQSTFSEAKTQTQTPNGLLRLFSLYENLTRFSMPFATQLQDRENPDVPISLSTNIVDISGVGIKQFWNLKSHMQVASQLATAHYPETLDRIFIIGAPMFFNTVWGWIKRWFDPITVSKIFVLSPAEVLPTLESFIEKRNIPKKYGGDLDFALGTTGVPDPHWEGIVQWEPGFDTFPTGPLLWEELEGGERLACVAHGSENGQRRHVRVCTIPKTWTPPVDSAQEKPVVDGVVDGAVDAVEASGKSSDETKVEAPQDVPAIQVNQDVASEPQSTVDVNEKPAALANTITPAVQTTV